MLHVDLPEGHRWGQRDNGLCCQGGDAVPGPRVVLGPSTPARAAAAEGHSWGFVRGTGHVLSSENGGAEWDLMERRAVYNRLKHPPPPFVPSFLRVVFRWPPTRGVRMWRSAPLVCIGAGHSPRPSRVQISAAPHGLRGCSACDASCRGALLGPRVMRDPPPPARAGPSGPSCAVPLPRLWAQA